MFFSENKNVFKLKNPWCSGKLGSFVVMFKYGWMLMNKNSHLLMNNVSRADKFFIVNQNRHFLVKSTPPHCIQKYYFVKILKLFPIWQQFRIDYSCPLKQFVLKGFFATSYEPCQKSFTSFAYLIPQEEFHLDL